LVASFGCELVKARAGKAKAFDCSAFVARRESHASEDALWGVEDQVGGRGLTVIILYWDLSSRLSDVGCVMGSHESGFQVLLPPMGNPMGCQEPI